METKIKKLLGRGFSLKTGFKKQVIYPSRDWALTFFSFLLLNLILVAFLMLVYFDMGHDDVFFNPQVESRLLFERDLFEERLNQYRDRAKQLETSLSNRPETVDPSI